MARMTDDELVALVEQRESQSYGYDSGELSARRAEAIKRYLGEQYVDAPEGRSSVVDDSLRSTILWIMPQLLRVFLGSDQVVRFEATGPEDEAQARQETEYINYVATERNESFQGLHTWFLDALLSGNGYAKVWWESDESISTETYVGKGEDEFAAIAQDPDVEIIEQSEYPDPAYVPQPMQDEQTGEPMIGPDGQPMMQPAPMLYDCVVRRVRPIEYARWEPVPPEEILVDMGTRTLSLQDATFVQHRRKVTVSDLREMGYDVPDDIAEWYDEDVSSLDEALARDRFDEDDWDEDDADPASRRVTYRESYMRVDANRDGKAELMRVCVVARKVLHKEEADHIPFACLGTSIMPHRHVALSMHDILEQIGEVKTALMRALMDSLYLSTAPRLAIDVNRVNADDLLTVRPGGIVRVKGDPGTAVVPQITPNVGSEALSGIQYIDAWRQEASGVNPYMQGGTALDSQALNKTASGVSQLVTQAQMRIEAIARCFADTGVKDLFWLLHTLTRKNSTRDDVVKLNNQWVTISPRSWVERYNLSVTVALGAGTKEMQVAQLNQLLATQMQLMPMGVVTPQNLYSTLSRLVQAMGFRNAEEFAANPAMQPPAPPPPPDPLVQAEQIKAQASLQVKQVDAQSKQQQSQIDAQIEQQKQQLEFQRTVQEMQAKLELQRQEMQLRAETDIAIARMKAEMEVQKAVAVKRLELDKVESDDTRLVETQGGLQQVMGAIEGLQQSVEVLAQEIARRASQQVVRDQRGRVVGTVDSEGNWVSQVKRDANGRVTGITPPMQ